MGLVHRASWDLTEALVLNIQCTPCIAYTAYHTRPMLPEVSGLRFKTIVLLIALF